MPSCVRTGQCLALTDKFLPSHNTVHRLYEIGRCRTFHNIGAGFFGHGALNRHLGGVLTQKNDFSFGSEQEDLLCSFNATQNRQVDVQNND